MNHFSKESEGRSFVKQLLSELALSGASDIDIESERVEVDIIRSSERFTPKYPLRKRIPRRVLRERGRNKRIVANTYIAGLANGEIASPYDMKSRISEQDKRFTNLREGELTREWRVYGERRGL